MRVRWSMRAYDQGNGRDWMNKRILVGEYRGLRASAAGWLGYGDSCKAELRYMFKKVRSILERELARQSV